MVQPLVAVDICVSAIWVLQTRIHSDNDTLFAGLLNVSVWVIPKSPAFAHNVLLAHVGDFVRTISDHYRLRAGDSGSSRGQFHTSRRSTSRISNFPVPIWHKLVNQTSLVLISTHCSENLLQ